jgi:hypothetical protein
MATGYALPGEPPTRVTTGSRVRLNQPKLPEGNWDVTVWDAPTYSE